MDTIDVGFTQFMDYTLKGSVARVNYVRTIKTQSEYNPAFDFWRKLREEIKNIHQNNLDVETLDNLLTEINEKKINQYSQAINRYKKFCKGKDIEWFDVGRSFWAFDRLVIRSTPEMGLIINGVPYVIKMYFKEQTQSLDKRKANSLLTLMEDSSYSENYPNAIRSVLNIKKGQLLPLDKQVTDTMRLSLEAEAMGFIHLWDKV